MDISQSSQRRVIPFKIASSSPRRPSFAPSAPLLLPPLASLSLDPFLHSLVFPPLFFVWSKAPPSPSFLLLLFLALILRFPLSWSILFFVIVVVPQYLFSFVVWAPDFSCQFSDTPSHSHAKRRSWLSTISFYMDEKSVDSFSSSLASPFPPPFSWVLYLCICIEILYCIFI